jgi:hypothetical protein
MSTPLGSGPNPFLSMNPLKAYVATLAASLGIPEDKINSVTKAIESGNSEEIAKAVKEATDSIQINRNMMQPNSNLESMSPEMLEQAKKRC